MPLKCIATSLPVDVPARLLAALNDVERDAGITADVPIHLHSCLVRDLDYDLVRLAALTRRLTPTLGPTTGTVIANVCTVRGRVADVTVSRLADALNAASGSRIPQPRAPQARQQLMPAAAVGEACPRTPASPAGPRAEFREA